MRVAFCGLSHLGICMSIAAHGWNWDVVAFDLNDVRVSEIQSGVFDPAEPGVADFLKSSPDRFLVSSDLADIHDVDLAIIAIDTQLDESGGNDESEASELLKSIAKALKPTAPIVVASQVRPGFTREHSHLHERLFYLMETLIFGSGISRAISPERYVVGSRNPDEPLPPVLDDFFLAAGCPIHVMSYESAELTKLAANFVLAANITAANSVAEIAENIGANWGQVEAALREDTRIGSKAYISAGLGVGGSNLSRDLFGLRAIAETSGASTEVTNAILRHSNYMRSWAIRVLIRIEQEQGLGSIALLGLSYKPGTVSTRNSAALEVVEAFGADVSIRVHDPAVRLPPHLHGGKVHQFDSASQALDDARVVVVATPHPQYRLDVESFIRGKPRAVIVDPFRLVDPDWICWPETQLIQLGVSFDQ